jgi:hypothetical protein
VLSVLRSAVTTHNQAGVLRAVEPGRRAPTGTRHPGGATRIECGPRLCGGGTRSVARRLSNTQVPPCPASPPLPDRPSGRPAAGLGALAHGIGAAASWLSWKRPTGSVCTAGMLGSRTRTRSAIGMKCGPTFCARPWRSRRSRERRPRKQVDRDRREGVRRLAPRLDTRSARGAERSYASAHRGDWGSATRARTWRTSAPGLPTRQGSQTDPGSPAQAREGLFSSHPGTMPSGGRRRQGSRRQIPPE